MLCHIRKRYRLQAECSTCEVSHALVGRDSDLPYCTQRHIIGGTVEAVIQGRVHTAPKLEVRYASSKSPVR